MKSRHDRSGRGLLKGMLIALGIAFFIGTILLFAPSFFAGTLITALSPLWKTSNAISSEASTNLGFFRSKLLLIEENKALKASLEETRLKTIAYEALKEEYAVLTATFGRSAPQGFILAGVLVRPPQAPYDNLIVDAGLEEGVRIGDVAFASDAIILGEVVEVYEHKAKVELYSTALKIMSGFVSRTGTGVELVGRGGGDFEVSISRDAEVTEQDMFVTAGVSGYVIASVKAIDSRPTDAVQKVLAQSPANMSQIRWVALRRK